MSKYMSIGCFFTLMILFITNSAFAQKQTMGIIEKAAILPENLIIDAKLDTGADSCSLHASNIKEFEKDGKEYIKFTITDRYGKKIITTREVVRSVRIKRINGKAQIRKMVHLGLCLGNVYKVAEVSLVNRGKFNYGLLIGRRYLAGDFIVDPAVTYTTDAECKLPKEVLETSKK